jgi:regulatory protein
MARSAVDAALSALQHRDLSTLEFEQRLTAKGFSEPDRGDAIATLVRTGMLDDRRFAEARAGALAARGAGNALIRDALERVGIDAEVLEEAIAALETEAERARLIVARRGSSARTARYLSGKGFMHETIGAVVAAGTRDEIG